MNSTVFFFLAVVGCAVAATHHINRRGVEESQAAITNQEFKSDPEGNFEYAYETQNGISARAHGAPKVVGAETAEVIDGTFAWTSPEGKTVNVKYTADENGYRTSVNL